MLIPVILSGGAGTRLWPVSREAHPKPFMSIAGGKCLLTQTYERALTVSEQTSPLIVTNRNYYFLSHDELANQDVQARYLLEPTGRNTAPAIALAALWALHQRKDAIMLVLPADHLIKDTPTFNAAVRQAEALAKEGQLVLFGVRPTGPETGFGYIEMGESVAPFANSVKRFVEKPDAETAAAYLAQGNYVWNSGMFCFAASTIIETLDRLTPELMQAAREVWAQTRGSDNKLELPDSFSQLEDISIDYAVMEKVDNISVIPGNFDWSDIGAWSAVAEACVVDAMGNSASDNTIIIDSHNTHIRNGKRLVAAIGVENLLIIDTPDALLVADKSKSQEVRQVVMQLKASHNETQKEHLTVLRPWGSYTVLEEGAGFKLKRIIVKPGASLSLQMHHHRSEHWVVTNGTAECVNGDAIITLKANQSTYIPAGCKHRLANVGDTELCVIEVQCGHYVGEDDIVRFEDVYGRV